MKIYLDGELLDEAEAKISVFDHGLLYGDGVFEGIRFYNGRVFKLQEHTDRLFDSAKAICLTVPATKDEINEAMKAAAEGPLKGILGYTTQPNVSSDFNHDPHSSIFHTDQTKVIDGDFVRVMSWYDNEWGFSNRMADTAVAMAKLI